MPDENSESFRFYLGMYYLVDGEDLIAPPQLVHPLGSDGGFYGG
jgi:hypothetical protein